MSEYGLVVEVRAREALAPEHLENCLQFVADTEQTFYREASTCHIVTKICFLILITKWERKSGVVSHRLVSACRTSLVRGHRGTIWGLSRGGFGEGGKSISPFLEGGSGLPCTRKILTKKQVC